MTPLREIAWNTSALYKIDNKAAKYLAGCKCSKICTHPLSRKLVDVSVEACYPVGTVYPVTLKITMYGHLERQWKALGQSAGVWQGGEEGEAHTAWAAESVKDELNIPGLLNVAVARHLYSLFQKIEKACSAKSMPWKNL